MEENRNFIHIATIEPNLRRYADHYFNYNLAISRIAISSGHDFTCYSSREFDLNTTECSFRIVPLFNFKSYAIDIIRIKFLPQFIKKSISQAILIIDFCMNLFKISKLLQGQPFFVVTAIKPYQIIGLFLFLRLERRPIHASITINTGELFDPSMMTRFISKFFKKISKVCLFRMQAVAHHKVHILTDSERIKAQLIQALGVTNDFINLLPIPVISDSQNVKHLKKSPSKIIFGFLGAAREEKGFSTFQKAVSHLSHLNLACDFTFLIQLVAPDGITPSEANAMKTISDLANNDFVKTIEGSLDPDLYKKTVAQIDVLILPYDCSSYEYRTSGLFAEAMAAGKVTIVPEATWMADHVKKFKCGITYQQKSYSDLCRAIFKTKDDFAKLNEMAETASEIWNFINNPVKTFDVLIGNPKDL